MKKQVSIVLGTFNRLGFLMLTIESIRRELASCSCPDEIVVVDGGSTDGTLDWLIKQKDIVTIVQHNRGEWMGRQIERRSWGYFMNLGFKCAQGKYICMLSDDCLVVPGAIQNGIALFEKRLAAGNKIGAAAFYWRNWPEQQEYSIFHFYGSLNVNHGLYLRQALIDVDYAEPDLFRFYYGDIDLSFKLIQQGYDVIPSETSYIEHFMHVDSESRAENFMFDGVDGECFVRKWGEIFGLEKFIADNRVKVTSKEFIDPFDTASQFVERPRCSFLRRIFRR